MIGNARIAGLEKDLGMAGYDYNMVLTSFAITYIVAEIPSNVLCKKIGPGWYLPAITLIFGGLSIATGYVKSYGAMCGVRALLGIFESGMMPGIGKRAILYQMFPANVRPSSSLLLVKMVHESRTILSHCMLSRYVALGWGLRWIDRIWNLKTRQYRRVSVSRI